MARRHLASAALLAFLPVCGGCFSTGSGPMFPRLWAWCHGATIVDGGSSPCCEGPALDGGAGFVVPQQAGPPPITAIPTVPAPIPTPQGAVPPLAPPPRLVPEAQQAQPKAFSPMNMKR